MNFDWNHLSTLLQTQGIKLLSGLLVLAIGFFLAHWITKLTARSKVLTKLEPTLKGFLVNLLKLLLYVLVILTAASVMGVPLTSFITLLASAGVAISLAVQGALSNFVGGLTILLLKPFRVGEYVKIGDIEGTVQKTGVFYTELTTPDNRHISLPNSSLTSTAIINNSREGTRRIDVAFSVSYSADIDQVRATLMQAVERTGRYLPDPAPMIRLTQCADSCLVFTVRVWVNSADYWEVNWGILENGKRALDAAGIEIPYPQMDVHMR